jgi:DNA gyrase subunit A
MIINKSGVTIRLKLSEVSIQGRVTQGVKLINLTKRNDFISNVCVVATEEDEEYIENNEAIEEALPTTEE